MQTQGLGMKYDMALKVLETLRRGPRPVASEALPNMPNIDGQPSVQGKPATSGMNEWLRILGYSPDEINFLNLIHVAGTKGKGATCAYVECLLRQHARRTGYPRKTGLYTSPHLNHVQERIRINFEPLSEDKFAKYVSDVYQTLNIPKLGNDAPKYLQFLTLVSLHVFKQEGVDVAIYETHQGGEFDATNIISRPLVTAITPIDRDHMHQLGPTLEHVAWHKGGIFKPGAPAFSAPQQPALASVLRSRADEKGVFLQFVEACPDFPADVPPPESEVQLGNFSLACAISNEFLRQRGQTVLSTHDQKQAIRKFSWPGRFQRISDGNITWFLDGAHNELSLETCADWFARWSVELEPGDSVHRILIFSQLSYHRDHAMLLKSLACSLLRYNIFIQHALFTPYSYITSASKDTQSPILDLYSEHWKSIHPGSHVQKFSTPDEALQLAASFGRNKTHVLVTGSLHLVGEAIRILGISAT